MQLRLHNRKSQCLKNNELYHCFSKINLFNSRIWQHQWGIPVPYTSNATARLIEN